MFSDIRNITHWKCGYANDKISLLLFHVFLLQKFRIFVNPENIDNWLHRDASCEKRLSEISAACSHISYTPLV